MSQPADWTGGTAALLVSGCPVCGHRWYLPRGGCPECGGSVVERRPAKGLGVVRGSTTVHRLVAGSGDGPVGIALVDLDEGVRVMARCTPGMPVGERVRVSFPTYESGPGGSVMLPLFEVILA